MNQVARDMNQVARELFAYLKIHYPRVNQKTLEDIVEARLKDRAQSLTTMSVDFASTIKREFNRIPQSSILELWRSIMSPGPCEALVISNTKFF